MVDYERERTVEQLKKEIFTLLKMEVTSNPAAFPYGLETVRVTIIDTVLTLGLPEGVETANVSADFKRDFATTTTNLKRFMYDPEVGTWIAFTIYANFEDDTYLYLFNYDEEESLDFNADFANERFKKELALYPRMDTFIPDWWKEKMRGNRF